MRVVRVTPGTVYVQADSNSGLGMSPDEAIALRDLLLREFPLDQPQITAEQRDAIQKEYAANLHAVWQHKERRERIATAALTAVQMDDPDGRYSSWEAWASDALDLADALIAALDEKKP